jgi:hypothetical protein
MRRSSKNARHDWDAPEEHGVVAREDPGDRLSRRASGRGGTRPKIAAPNAPPDGVEEVQRDGRTLRSLPPAVFCPRLDLVATVSEIAPPVTAAAAIRPSRWPAEAAAIHLPARNAQQR